MSDVEHTGVIDATALRRYAERVMALRAERKTINSDMGAVFDEAKSAGFVPAMIRGLVRELEMEDEARNTYYATQDAYRRALGLGQLLNTPLGEATLARETSAPSRRRGRPRNGANVTGDALETALATAATIERVAGTA